LLERRRDDSGKILEDFAASLEHLNRALELNGSLLEALFNRALLYEEMMLPQQAEEDWRKYLEKDPSSRWADEAKRRIEAIEGTRKKASRDEEQLFQNFMNAFQLGDKDQAWDAFTNSYARGWNPIVERLLDDFLDLESKGQIDGAARKIQALSFAGEMQSSKSGDRFTGDLADYYGSAAARQHKRLAEARSLMKSAHEHFAQSRLEAAMSLYERARKIFDLSGDYCEAKYVDYRIGHCYLRKPDIKTSLSIFERLAADCDNKDYKWLLARAFYSMADASFGLNEYSRMLNYSGRSLEISKQISDINGTVRCNAQLAILYQQMGDYPKSLNYVLHSLDLVNSHPVEAAQVSLVYDIASDSFTWLRSYEAALSYQEEGLRLAMQMANPLKVSRCYVFLGLINGALNNYEEALKNVRLSYEIGKSLSDESIGQEIKAFSALRLGHLYKQMGDYSKAIESYDENINIYNALDFPAEGYAAHKGKLLCYIDQANDNAAISELQVTLALFEQYRSRIMEETNRNTFFDREQDIYDIAINFEYTRLNNPEAAFEYSETCRARSLLDSTKSVDSSNSSAIQGRALSTESEPSNLAEIKERLPDNIQILQYAALEDKLLIWVVSKSGISSAEEKIGLDELVEKVTNYIKLISQASDSGEKKEQAVARELYNSLITPVEPFLDRGKHLYIVPDKILNYLPFGSLIRPVSNEYLLNNYALAFAPSSTLFLKCSDAALRRSKNNNEKYLGVGNPYFNRSRFPSLREIPSSAREVQQIAALYPASKTLIGREARESITKTEMAVSDVIHLATHYVVDSNSYMHSGLLLASGPNTSVQSEQSDGMLQVQELYAMKLTRARLVVLAACQTAIERFYRGEGAIGIARPFIAAGLPLIVASLWPVESNSTSELMISFHKFRKNKSLSTIEAMRSAQLEMLASSDNRYRRPYYWAGFIVIGGQANF
jgi:CHAT domain-containing protein